MLQIIPLISIFSINGQTYQFAIKPTGVTVQLIIQTSPPKRGVSRSTIRTFSFRLWLLLVPLNIAGLKLVSVAPVERVLYIERSEIGMKFLKIEVDPVVGQRSLRRLGLKFEDLSDEEPETEDEG